MKLILVVILFFNFGSLFSQTEQTNFGSNPGKLKCYSYTPKTKSFNKPLPLVVALHGCTQDVAEFSSQSGWNELAEKHGFIVLYPEQRKINNTSSCFNWFNKPDIHFSGESLSIMQMIEHLKKITSVDSSLIFTYGVSAGAAMSVALLAQYPDVFKSGASIAGVPYGLAENFTQAYTVMKDNGKTTPTSLALASYITELHDSPKSYPSLIIVHAEDDQIVSPTNAKNLTTQWTEIHSGKNQGIFSTIDTTLNNIKITSYIDSNTQDFYIKSYSIPHLGHALPVDPGIQYNQGGKIGKYAKDIDFFSTFYIARDFGLIPK